MHYNTIYLAIFTAVAVSASSILPRQLDDDPSDSIENIEHHGIQGPPSVCVGLGQHCDSSANCCEDGSAGMFISVPSIHYYIDLSLPAVVCGFSNVCLIVDPTTGNAI